MTETQISAATLYVLGVGPGDPELLTLKAARILRETGVIFVPKGREEGSSLALSIVQGAIDLAGKEIVEAHFPMKKTAGEAALNDQELTGQWDAIAMQMSARLGSGRDVAFITIGDPTIYSTFFYLYDRLLGHLKGLKIEIVPGVSSVTAAAARAGLSLGLGDERIAILPATYAKGIDDALSSYDTVVLMKVHRVLDKVIQALDKAGLAGKAVYVARAGMGDDSVVKPIEDVTDEDITYFSLVIVRRNAA